MAGDMEQVSLVHVLAPAQPCPAHAAAIEVVRKGALDDLGAQLEGFLGQYIRSGLGRFTRSNPGIRIYTREVNRLSCFIPTVLPDLV